MIRALIRLAVPLGIFLYFYGGSNSMFQELARTAKQTANVTYVGIQLPIYCKSIAMEYTMSGAFPSDVGNFLNDNFRSNVLGDLSVDPWGGYYNLEIEASTFLLRSAGPDVEYWTEDDIYHQQAIPEAMN